VVASAELIDELRHNWGRLMPLHPMLGEGVLTRLCEPRRQYPGARHLRQGLRSLDELGGAQRAEYLALWYRNVVALRTPEHHGRAAAAVAATELLGIGFPWVEAGQVSRLILITADHQPRPELPGSERVSDADLSGLASSLELVVAAFSQRRAELVEMPEEECIQWQRGWIEGMLARERIFHTEVGYELWEAPARRNLAALLELPPFA
jgi:predicted metal-dependent HD superfamily phosphohydrolase